jgi:hypothetical protein
MTDANLDLGAAPVVAVPAAALPTIVAAVSRKPGWVRPAAIAALGAGIASGVIGVAFQARASPAAPAVANGSQVPARTLTGSAEVDRNASLARGFYVAAAVLAAAGGGLLWWDLQADAMGVQAHF